MCPVPSYDPGTVPALLARSAAAHPDRPALRLGADELTFAELDGLSSLATARLRSLGTAPGDRVALLLPNSPVFAVLYYGILRAGAIVVPLNPLLKAGEVEHCLSDAGAALLLTWHQDSREAVEGARRAGTPCLVVEPEAFLDGLRGCRPPARDEPRSPADSAVVLYTSGTTGRPKGAELTHRNLRRNVEEGARVLRLGPADVVFGGLPLFHSFGQVMGLNCAVSVGACLTLLPRFTPADALSVIERDRVTVFLGVPTMYLLMLRLARSPGYEPRDLSTLRVGLCGGSPLPVEVLRAFEGTFACAVLEGYGLSESSPLACVNRIDRERVAGTVGIPLDGVEMRVVDRAGRELPDGEVGEIVIRGHNVMRGYWRRPRATAEAVRDGWLHTGDLGTRDARGDFRIVDRIKDLVIRGGLNVYPREVEEVLHAHPAVAEAAVVGVPHEIHGQEVAAAVVLRDGASATAQELLAFVRERVAPFKYPRIVWITDHLPKGPTGKVLKREIVRLAPGPGAN
ncbi:long-chain-fatty-acid--CoA ligase [Streptomyces sudanensis]|uniref:long-chain-fatty-acid--CoA ligase n=1 Tax=Streptomyces sudanensis TaxID=436397 RepID=UPI0020CCD8A0|nr:long-chain fatty acid--CoA ligase [Streptomyces sudanensis]MCP9956119.1 long-chain fatty acid--CoA ligase [Streptomyces sudanensis]MCP9985346.1 long-chain fatty acid--CoA ligase [Streptomyces sudanensis]MCQ0003242.1 long-chain fatty acid--CoA ligase [Streptomyces sudanensis]